MNGPGEGKRPFSSASDTTGTCSSSVRRQPAGKGTGGARRCRFCSHGELPYRRKQGDDGAGTLTPGPNTVQRHLSDIWSDSVYAHWRSRVGGAQETYEVDARIWKGITSDANWERSRHEPGANLSTLKRRGSLGSC